MKIGVIGPAKRAVVWEDHLAGHPSVSEVIIAADLEKAGNIDACLLLNDDLNEALSAIKKGIHTFLIAKLPTEFSAIEKLYYASEEANVQLQFSHWPTLAPASQWAAIQVPNPSFLQITREINYTHFLENDSTLSSLLIDELAYSLKCIGSSVHQITHNNSVLSGKTVATHLTLRFDNSATAAIYINIAADGDNHRRFISDNNYALDCDVENQHIRIGRSSEDNHLFFDRKEFDSSVAAEQATTRFLKAIRLKKPSAYSGYDLLRLSRTLKKIDLN